MEDLKQIQEFFSKPLEEGKQLDQVDFAKVVKAVEQTGHPVTVLLVPKFNEIEVLTGMDAPDDMLRDLSNAVDSLGYGHNDIFIAADSSNLSRREYSDIRRVNGGAKDYFEESLDEAKRPEPNYKELVKLLIMAFKHEPKSRFYFNRNNGVVYFDLIGGAAYSPKKSKMRDIFGGMSPIAVNKEFGRADHHEEETIKQVEQLSKGKIKAEIKELGNGVLYKLKNTSVNENKPVANVNRHIKAIQIQLDQLGVKYEMSGNPYKPFKAVYKPINKDDKWYDNFEDIVFRYNLGGVVKTSMNEGAEDIMDAYNDVLDLVKKHSRRLSDDDSYAFGLKLKSWFNKNILDEATKDEETTFHKKLDKLVHDTFGKRKGELEEGASTEEKRIAMSAIKRIAKYRGVSEDEARNDLVRAAKELGSLKEAVKDMFETIKLGQQLNEELCDKGKRYIKARQAAGEKSSAYLSGRAVRVCKGQIEWPKKGKKK